MRKPPEELCTSTAFAASAADHRKVMAEAMSA